MMRQLQIDLVQKSWKKILPMKVAAAEIFYKRLFELDPTLRELLEDNLIDYSETLIQMVDTAIEELNDWDQLDPFAQVLGVKLAKFGVKEKNYETFGAALISTLMISLGAELTEDIKSAWIAIYAELASTMKQAACELSIH